MSENKDRWPNAIKIFDTHEAESNVVNRDGACPRCKSVGYSYLLHVNGIELISKTHNNTLSYDFDINEANIKCRCASCGLIHDKKSRINVVLIYGKRRKIWKVCLLSKLLLDIFT